MFLTLTRDIVTPHYDTKHVPNANEGYSNQSYDAKHVPNTNDGYANPTL